MASAASTHNTGIVQHSPASIRMSPAVATAKPIRARIGDLIIFDEKLGEGGEQTVYLGQKGVRLIAVGVGNQPMPALVMRVFGFYARLLKDLGQTRFYCIPEYKQIGPARVAIMPLMNGQGTYYKGLDGYSICFERYINRSFPYPDPAKNAIRLFALNSLLGLRDFYQDAQYQGSNNPSFHEVVYGDFKGAQLLNQARAKPGMAHNLTSLVLTDPPRQLHPTLKTTGYFDPDVYQLGKGYHYNDLFAFQAHLARLLERTLNHPLCEGDQKPALTVEAKQINEMLVRYKKSTDMAPHYRKWYRAAGHKVVYNRGTTIIYPLIFHNNIRDAVYKKLDQVVAGMAPSSSKEVATCLLESMHIVLPALKKSKDLKDDPKAAQQTVLETLEKVEANIRARYLPHSGPTGSPITIPSVVADGEAFAPINEEEED